MEAAADKPGTAQYHRKMTAALQKQIDERRDRQRELETVYREKKEEYTTVRQEYDQVCAGNNQSGEKMSHQGSSVMSHNLASLAATGL